MHLKRIYTGSHLFICENYIITLTATNLGNSNSGFGYYHRIISPLCWYLADGDGGLNCLSQGL